MYRMGPNSGFEMPVLTETQKQRFWNRVKTGDTNSCWVWTGASFNGYGRVNIGYRNCIAHRVAYSIYNQIALAGKVIAHKCDNPLCVNPKHLVATDQRGNMQDCISKGRFNRPRGSKHWRAKQQRKMEVYLAL